MYSNYQMIKSVTLSWKSDFADNGLEAKLLSYLLRPGMYWRMGGTILELVHMT